MNTKNLITRTVIVFAALALAGIGMAIGARNLVDAFDQTILIAVGVALETMKQIDSQLMMRNYEGFLK